MTVRRLSREDIQELLGPQESDTVEDFEVLFNGFHELDCLENFPRLKRLCCIDNGINRICNLEPVAMTLTILNLSDQEISRIENLNLPNLRELYLHRNFIRSMNGLTGCPRLKKLWLCQNQITTISDLHNLPELEELWLQSNRISSLQGLENCRRLNHLGVAGNYISDFAEIRRLASLSELKIVCFQDIHFGRCPIADSDGYKAFVLNHLKQVTQLDGVAVSGVVVEAAKGSLISHVRQFNDMIQDIEVKHREELQTISYKQQARTSHSSVLEKEMNSALVELEALIMEGRGTISRQVKKQQDMLQRNISDLQIRIDNTYETALTQLERSVIGCKTEYDMAEAMFYTIEMVYTALDVVVEVLCSVTSGLSPSKHGHGLGGSAHSVMHHPVSDSTPDFKYMASMFRGKADTGQTPSDGILQLGLVKLFRLNFLTATHGLDEVSIAKARDGDLGFHETSLTRAFTVLRPDQLGHIIRDGWAAITDAIIFSTHPGVAASLYSADGGSRFSLSDIDTHSNLSGSDISGPVMDEGDMMCLQEAKKMQPLLLVSCEIDMKKCGLDKLSQGAAASTTIRIPATETTRREMLMELKKARKAVSVQIDYGRGQLFVLPTIGDVRDVSTGDHGSVGVHLDYVCLCTCPPIEDGLRGLELRMETMVMPSAAETDWLNRSSSGGAQSSFLAQYDKKIYGEVHNYVDHVLEELDATEADILRAAHQDIHSKEAALRALKEELANERRLQENLLKDMKQAQAPPAPVSQKAGVGGIRKGR